MTQPVVHLNPNGILSLEHEHLTVRVSLQPGVVRLVDVKAGSDVAFVADGDRDTTGGQKAVVDVRTARPWPASAEATCIDVTTETDHWRIWLYPEQPAFGIQHLRADAATDGATHISWSPAARHSRLRSIDLIEQTDRHDSLVHEKSYLLWHEEPLRLGGLLFAVTDPASGAGLALLTTGVSPQSRPWSRTPDLQWGEGRLVLGGDELRSGRPGYIRWFLPHRDWTAALQKFQNLLQPPVPGKHPLALSNTWGDRSMDAQLGEDFARAEIDAAADMGIDIVQLDDGWQRGRAGTAAITQGFYRADPDFWLPSPARFPRGLGPVAAYAADKGVGLGLWFAPDSDDELASWERDAETMIRLAREHDLVNLKLDMVDLTTPLAEERFHALFERVGEALAGRTAVDADVTNARRFGYFGQPASGPIFVENRYTDWGNYWPHRTFRNLWQLSHHIHPSRLRMEFPNHYRNPQHPAYIDEPLAPAHWPAATPLATVLFSSPLAWFELSNAGEELRAAVGSLLRAWHPFREGVAASTVRPIGEEPDGYTWAGFCSEGSDQDPVAVVIRPLGDDPEWSFVPPHAVRGVRVLHGDAEATVERDGSLSVRITAPLGHALLRLERV